MRHLRPHRSEWCAKGIFSAMDSRKAVPFDLLTDLAEVHKKGRPFNISCVMEMPQGHALRSYLEDLRVRSMLALPLMQEGFCIGFMGMEAVREIRQFTDMNITPLTLAAGIITNIIIRQKAEKILRESEKKYQSLFHNSQVALFRTYVDGRLVEINQRYAELAGYSTVEDCVAQFVPGRAWADTGARKEFLKILQEKGRVSDYETKMIHRDGSHIWILFSAAISSEQGFIEGSILDITGRKQTEAEKEKLQDLYPPVCARRRCAEGAIFGNLHSRGKRNHSPGGR